MWKDKNQRGRRREELEGTTPKKLKPWHPRHRERERTDSLPLLLCRFPSRSFSLSPAWFAQRGRRRRKLRQERDVLWRSRKKEARKEEERVWRETVAGRRMKKTRGTCVSEREEDLSVEQHRKRILLHYTLQNICQGLCKDASPRRAKHTSKGLSVDIHASICLRRHVSVCLLGLLGLGRTILGRFSDRRKPCDPDGLEKER